jgi:hypothetical protein
MGLAFTEVSFALIPGRRDAASRLLRSGTKQAEIQQWIVHTGLPALEHPKAEITVEQAQAELYEVIVAWRSEAPTDSPCGLIYLRWEIERRQSKLHGAI